MAQTVATAGSIKPASANRARYERIFDEVMRRYALPGLALGVIENGKVAYVRTAGERVAGSGKAITPYTLFKIASNSKAMTASVLARLVQAGKLRWDDPVAKFLPDFRLFDDEVSRHFTVTDLLVHHSGLPEGGGDLMLWPEPNRFTRGDILAGLAHLKPAYGFRAGYAYDNLLYVVAGEVAAAAGGASYEELVRREVFAPLGLACKVGEFTVAPGDDVAQPHRRSHGRARLHNADGAVVPTLASAAAGGIRCSLDDLLIWARQWLRPDARSRAWLGDEQRRELWRARTPMPIPARMRDWNGTQVYAYAYGFRLADMDGERTVSHTGTLSGMYSVMLLLPDRGSGFVMLANGEASEARTVLTEALLKAMIAPKTSRTVAELAADLDRRAKASPKRAKAADASARMPAKPEELTNRLGVWRDPWFGEASLCVVAGQVRWASVKSPLLAGEVVRVGDRYLLQWDRRGVDLEAWMDFSQEGDEATMKLAKTDPDGDFSYDYEDLAFVRIRSCERDGQQSAEERHRQRRVPFQ